MASIEHAGTVQGEITIDTAQRSFTVTQRLNRFALQPDTVVIPFDTVKMLAAQAILIDAGQMAVGPVVGKGKEADDAGAALSSVSRVN